MTESALSRFGSLEDARSEIRRGRGLRSGRTHAEAESLLSTPVRSASLLAPAVSLGRRLLRRLLRPWLAQQDETNRRSLERFDCLEETLARKERAKRRELDAALDAVRRDLQEAARRNAEEAVRREALEAAHREALDAVRRDVEEAARRNAEDAGRREALEGARQNELEAARREARAARRALLEIRRHLSRSPGRALAGRTARLETEAARQDARLAKVGSLLSIGNDAFLLLRRDGSPSVSEKDLPPPLESSYVAALSVSGDLRTGAVAAAHSRALVPRFAGCRRVVDLGCGTGEFLEALMRAGIPAFGIDVDAGAVEACRRRGLNARVDDLFETLARGEAPEFDGAVLSHVIEHVGPVEALRVLLRIGARLPEGGLLLVVTPNPESLFTHLVHFWRDPTHVRPYPVELLRRFAAAAGFSVIEAGEVPESSESAWGL